jgi:hypothetical protein
MKDFNTRKITVKIIFLSNWLFKNLFSQLSDRKMSMATEEQDIQKCHLAENVHSKLVCGLVMLDEWALVICSGSCKALPLSAVFV